MKKCVLLIVATLMAVTAGAQRLQKAPGQLSHPTPAMRNTAPRKAQIAPNNNQVWWGYFAGNEDISSLGTGSAETFDMAIYIPAGHAMASDKTIYAMRIYMANASIVKNVKVWFNTSLPTNVDEAEYVQTVDPSTLTEGPNDVALTKTYKNAKGFYAGYSFTLTKAAYAIVQGGDYVKNGLFIRASQSVTSWEEQTSFGHLALQLLVENTTLPLASVSPKKFGPVGLELGETTEVPVVVNNSGKLTITEVAYTLNIDGQTSAEMKATAEEPIPYNGKGTVNVHIPAAKQAGSQTVTLTVTSVNGEANTSATPSTTFTLHTVAEMKEWPRTVLIEEFTTESCVYCPSAAQILQNMFTTYPEMKEYVAVACHHAGYYTDWLTVAASRSYTWLYNDNGSTYAPAFMYDRFAYDGKTPVNGRPSNAGYMKAYVDERANTPAHANVELQAAFSSDGKTLEVHADCQQAYPFASTPVRITLFLTEDNIKAQSQAGANGSFTHQHVLRNVNATWGTELLWQDDKATYDYTFTLDTSWKKDDLKVIAFVSGYDKSDPTNCVIENAAVVTVGNDPIVVGINNALATSHDNAATAESPIYRLDGVRMTKGAALPKGIYVIGGKKVVMK